MAFEQQRGEALHLLRGIEGGRLRSSDLAHLVEQADPALAYLVFTWLRHRYGHGHPAAEGVLGRIVELTEGHPAVRAKLREGKADPIVAFIEEERGYGESDAEAFVAFVVEKLEG